MIYNLEISANLAFDLLRILLAVSLFSFGLLDTTIS